MKTGRSLSEEIEWRLEASLEHEDARTRFFGGPELDLLFKQIAGAVGMIEQKTGRRWTEDYETYIAATAALERVLRQVRDTLKPTPSARSVSIMAEVINLQPKMPNVPRPTESELAGSPTEPAVGLLRMPIRGGTPRFASAEDAMRVEKEWRNFDQQQAAYSKKLEEANAYFAEYAKIGEDAVSSTNPTPKSEEQ
jgi:hypothetical protein